MDYRRLYEQDRSSSCRASAWTVAGGRAPDPAAALSRRFVGVVLLLLLGCADLPSDVDGQVPSTPRADLSELLEPCTVAGIPGPTLCGSYAVFEDREAASGRTIDLQILVARAFSEDADPDPVVYIQGGPGGSSVGAAQVIAPLLSDVRQTRDLVFVDQRGTGGSNRLACNTPLPSGEASLFGSLFPADHLRQCLDRLSVRADVRHYTTPVAVDDLAEVLEWLRYERANLFGTSYGTRPVLVFLRRHPGRVRTAVVNGVAPPHLNIHLQGAPNLERAVDWLIDDCAIRARRWPSLSGTQFTS